MHIMNLEAEADVISCAYKWGQHIKMKLIGGQDTHHMHVY